MECAGIFTGTLLLVAALMLPGFNTLFMVETLSGFNLLMIGILAFLPTFVFQVVRLIKEHYNKNNYRKGAYYESRT